jgi:hypothetical protein
MRVGIKRSGFSSAIGLLAIGLTATSAGATWGPVSDFTTTPADGSPGITYYDVYNGSTTDRGDLDQQLLFYLDTVRERDNLAHWSNLGYEILKNGGGEKAYWDHDGKGFDAEFGAGGDYVDLISEWGKNIKVANSFDELEFAARARVSDYFVHNGKREVGSSEINGIEAWQDDTTPRTIFYTDAFGADNDVGQRYYNYFGLAFYDFKLSLLADENLPKSTAADGYGSIEEAAEAGAPGVTYTMDHNSQDGFATGVTNDTTLPVTATQSVTSSYTTTVSNSITNSEAYSWDLMVGAEVSFMKDSPSLAGGWEKGVKIYSEFTAGGVYTTAYQETEQNSHTESNTSSVAVTLPSHTAVLLDQADITLRGTVKYDSPIVVSYRVAVYSLVGHKYWDGLITHYNYKDSDYLVTFGKDNGSGTKAHENLATRLKNSQLITNYEATFGDGLDWNAIYFTNTGPTSTRVKDSVDWLVSHRPMSVTGATLTYDYTGFQSEVKGVTPLYPLRHVEPAYSEMGMGYGTHKYVKDIPIVGKDASWTPYYGFNSRYGHWILVDESGNPVTSSPIASLTTDPVSGEVILTAGSTTGVLYLKYIIDEDKYSFGTGQSFLTSNADLTSTALIKLMVVPSVAGDPQADPELERGSAANGSGWYLLDDASRVDFAFNVKQVSKTANNPQYRGKARLTNDGKWRLAGDLTVYLNKDSLGKAYGVGTLQRWDSGQGRWVKADDNVKFKIGFEDLDLAGTSTETPDAFAVQIDYGVPAGGPSLPNSYLTQLIGGDITIKS